MVGPFYSVHFRIAFFLSKLPTVVYASVAFKMAATLTRGLSGMKCAHFIFKCHKYIAKNKMSFYGLKVGAHWNTQLKVS